MFTFSRLISKLSQKKIIFSLLLFLVLVGTFLPNTNTAKAYGVWWCAPVIAIPVLGTGCLAGTIIPSSFGDIIKDTAVDIGAWVAKYFLIIPLAATALGLLISKTLLIWVFEITSTLSFTSNQAVNLGWPIVRNLANIVIVVSLIATALAMILRMDMFGDRKKLLVSLIIAALLINFSLVICGLVIDASNITIKYLLDLDGKPQTNVEQFSQTEHFDLVFKLVTAPPDELSKTVNSVTIIGMELGVIFYQFMASIVLFLYVILFLFRMIALWILVILSPIAFAFYVLPSTRKISQMWWSNFSQWCFVGVFGAFFFFIGEKLMKNMLTNPIGGPVKIQASGLVVSFSTYIGPLIEMFVPGMFLVIGFIFSLQMSAMGGDLVKSVGNKIKGYAKTGAGKVAKWTADNTGVTRAKNALQYYGTRAGESVRLFGRGTAAANWKKQQDNELNEKKRQERVDALSATERADMMKSSNKAFNTVEGKADRAAIFKAMQKDGQTDLLTKEERLYAMQNIARRENSTNVFSTDADTAHLDTDKIKENKRKLVGKVAIGSASLPGNTTGHDIQYTENDVNNKNSFLFKHMQAEAEKITKKDAYNNMATQDIDKMNDAELAELTKQNTARGSKAIERAIKESKKHLIRGGKKTQLEGAIDLTQQYGVSTNLYSKASADIAHKDTDKVNEALIKQGLTRATATPTQLLDAKLIATRDAFDRMDTKDIKDKNDNDLIKLAEQETDEGAKALEEAIKRGIIHKVKGGVTADIGNLLIKAKNDYGSSAIKSAKKMDWRYAEFDQEAVSEIMTKTNPRTGATFTEPQARKQAKINEIKKLDSGKIRKDLPSNALNMELMQNLDVNTIEKLDERDGLSIEQKEQLKKLIEPGGDFDIAINNAKTLGHVNRLKKLKEKRKAIRSVI